MALRTRTITEMLNLAISIAVPFQTDPTLTAAEQAQVSECVLRLNDILADVNPNTNLVPQNRRNPDANTLFDRVRALSIVDDNHFEGPNADPTKMYDLLDLMFDMATAILAGQPTVTSDLSSARP